MPKTIEELEIEIATMKGELIAKQKQLDTGLAAVAHANEELKKSEEKLQSYEKKERDSLEAIIHGVNPKEDIKDLKLSELQAMCKGITLAHAVSPDVEPPHATAPVNATGKKQTDFETFFNA